MKNQKAIDKIIEDIDEQLTMATKFDEIISEIITTQKISKINKLYVVDNSAILQGYMNKFGFGLADLRLPWGQGLLRNFQMIANLPLIINDPERYSGTSDPMELMYIEKTALQQFLHILKKMKEEKINYEPEEEEYEKIYLGSLVELENSLVQAIYDHILKNPSLYHNDTRNFTDPRKKVVKRRDKFTCQICMKPFEEEYLEIDHIFPYSLGGSHERYNLMSLCQKCNADKGNRLDYYRIDEGKEKIKDNIRKFVQSLDLITDFGSWLKKQGDRRGRPKLKKKEVSS